MREKLFSIVFALLFAAGCGSGLVEEEPIKPEPQANPESQTMPALAEPEPLVDAGRPSHHDVTNCTWPYCPETVLFATNSFEIAPDQVSKLLWQLDFLRQNQNLRMVIEGHSDERGTREYNLALGERRANAHKRYLVSIGADADRIDVISYGEERPEDPGSTVEAWIRNRRTQVTFQPITPK